MIAGKHLDDDDLLELLASSDPASNEHLAACEECRARFDSFGMVAEALHDESVWDERPLNEAPVPSTIANLRAFAEQMANEDTVAAAALTSLLATPSDTWTIATLPQTAGMVRKLIEASEQSIDTMPPEAVTLAALATTLASSLNPAAYTSDTVSKVTAAAHRQHAYALFYTGSFAAAEEALCAAESHLSDCLVDEYDGARLGIVRALVDRGLEKYDTASGAVRASARTFATFEDLRKLASATLAEVNLLFSRNDFTTAFRRLNELNANVAECDTQTHALILGNLGHCAWQLGRIVDAVQYLEAAAVLLSDAGMSAEAVRVRWNAASILAAEGRLEEALVRLIDVRRQFDDLGMTSASTQASLEVAEILLVTSRNFEQVNEICYAAMRSFESTGLTHTSRALTAISLVSEAARNRTATPKMVRHVRDYIRRLPAEPNLLFAPLPE